MNIAYLRVSTCQQDERRQEIAFSHIKIDKKYIDKLSGKNTDRAALNKMQIEVNSGDNIYVESISRLGRNVDDLRRLVEYFKEKNVVVHFLKEGFNTSGETYKFLLTILGAVAEMEREMIVQRVREGVTKAKLYGTKSGMRIGRPARQLPENFQKYYQKWKSKEIKKVEFCKLINVSRMTLDRYIKHYERKII